MKHRFVPLERLKQKIWTDDAYRQHLVAIRFLGSES